MRLCKLVRIIVPKRLKNIFERFSGLIGKIVKYVTPLTIVPTVSLVGLSLFENAGESASKHWGISMGYVIGVDCTYLKMWSIIIIIIIMFTKNCKSLLKFLSAEPSYC